MKLNPELCNIVRCKTWPSPALTESELSQTRILQLVDWGMQVLAICPHGTYRSGLVTNRLNSIDIPTLRLDKGFDGIGSKYIDESIYRSLSKIPLIVGIIVDWEYEHSSQRLNIIRKLSKKTNFIIHGHDDPAVEEIKNIYHKNREPISSLDARCF